jgi:hypothetical protein
MQTNVTSKRCIIKYDSLFNTINDTIATSGMITIVLISKVILI